MPNVRLLLEYDGTAYVGWQAQENGPSIQGALLGALDEIIHERPTLHVAGRTDSGVHAFGQVVSFDTTSALAGYRFAPALNSTLPNDISVHRSDEVAADFHARFSATSKRYRYRVYCSSQRSSLEARFAWHLRQELDVAAMQAATTLLLGERDFESFRSAQCDAPHARRNMFSITVTEEPRPPAGTAVEIEFHADAFARHMCRILSGTLVEVGLGKRRGDELGRVLETRDRTLAGMTAPAHGLTLLEVRYDGRPRGPRS